MLATRLIFEVGDVIVGLVTGGTLANDVMISIIAVLELIA
jgi:hypothetical protein